MSDAEQHQEPKPRPCAQLTVDELRQVENLTNEEWFDEPDSPAVSRRLSGFPRLVSSKMPGLACTTLDYRQQASRHAWASRYETNIPLRLRVFAPLR